MQLEDYYMRLFIFTLAFLAAMNASAMDPSEKKSTLLAMEMAPKMTFLSLGYTSNRPGLEIVSLYGEKKSRGVRAICDFAFDYDEYGEPVFVDVDCKAGTRIGHFFR